MPPDSEGASRKSLVLLVDDEPCITEVLDYAFSQEGYRTVTAASIADVEKALLVEVPLFAVIDIALGEENGIDAARLLGARAGSGRVHVVFTSGLSREHVSLEDLPANVHAGFVQKAFSPRQIFAALKGLRAEMPCC